MAQDTGNTPATAEALTLRLAGAIPPALDRVIVSDRRPTDQVYYVDTVRLEPME